MLILIKFWELMVIYFLFGDSPLVGSDKLGTQIPKNLEIGGELGGQNVTIWGGGVGGRGVQKVCKLASLVRTPP